MTLERMLLAVAVLQLSIAILNLFLVWMMQWQSDMEKMPLLICEVFYVHSWFISITLTIFAVMTWRFSDEMVSGTNPACIWLAAGIGLFWLIRTILQVAWYSSSHWRGRLDRTAIHIACLVVYGGMSVIYLTVAWKGGWG